MTPGELLRVFENGLKPPQPRDERRGGRVVFCCICDRGRRVGRIEAEDARPDAGHVNRARPAPARIECFEELEMCGGGAVIPDTRGVIRDLLPGGRDDDPPPSPAPSGR